MEDKIKKDILDSIAVKQSLIATLPPVIREAAEMMHRCVKEGNKILFFGNGGSASDSQHLAAEFVGRYERERRGLAAIALTTDTSILTAVGNDYGFETVFRRQIEALGKKGDVAVGISTSGNSPNVLLGIQKAKEMGLHTIVFSGRDGGKMKGMADVSIVIPAQKTSRIQECHLMIGHILCERVDELFLD
jgi:D-sedoheptulose 7-phosphate isomerase